MRTTRVTESSLHEALYSLEHRRRIEKKDEKKNEEGRNKERKIGTKQKETNKQAKKQKADSNTGRQISRKGSGQVRSWITTQ